MLTVSAEVGEPPVEGASAFAKLLLEANMQSDFFFAKATGTENYIIVRRLALVSLDATSFDQALEAIVNHVAFRAGGKIVIHLLNFAGATHLDWRDDRHDQAVPPVFENFGLAVRTFNRPARVWMASPDIDGGVPRRVEWTFSGTETDITVPSLRYWTMIVIEPEEGAVESCGRPSLLPGSAGVPPAAAVYGAARRPSRWASPQSQRAPRMGPRVAPSGVSEYSTLGGITG